MSASSKGFAAGTVLLTEKGLTTIESITVGDRVLCYPFQETPPDRMRMESEETYTRVMGVKSSVAEHAVEMLILSFAGGVKESVTFGADQPIYVEKVGWVQAGALELGVALLNAGFGNNMCGGVKHVPGPVELYEISVEHDFAFYVGQAHSWVAE